MPETLQSSSSPEPFLQRMEKIGRYSFFTGLVGAPLALIGVIGLAIVSSNDIARTVLASIGLLGLVALLGSVAVYLVHAGVVLWYVRKYPTRQSVPEQGGHDE